MKTIGELATTLRTVTIAKGFPDYRVVTTNQGVTTNNDTVYEEEVKQAIAVINRCRRFNPSESVLYDEKYEDLIIPLGESSLAKVGAEGQTSHSENGVVRGYGNDGKYPSSILRTIRPLVK